MYTNPPSKTQPCAICSKPVPYTPRYPRYVCRECIARACSADGRPLRFIISPVTGAFAAAYADTDEPYPGHDCSIDGIHCVADEDYYRDVVVQVADQAPGEGK
jgi:hypothetical protein